MGESSLTSQERKHQEDKNTTWKFKQRAVSSVPRGEGLHPGARHILVRAVQLVDVPSSKVDISSFAWRNSLRSSAKVVRTSMTFDQFLPRNKKGDTNLAKEAYTHRSCVEEIRNYDTPPTHRAAKEHLNERCDGVRLLERAVHLGYFNRQFDVSRGGSRFALASTQRATPKGVGTK